MKALEIIGRTSSLFTRVPMIFAHELKVPVTLCPIYEITAVETSVYGGNPALKFPTLRRSDGSLVFGAENMARTLADLAGSDLRIVWPEQLRSDLSRNAQELVWHSMAAQVQLVFGTIVGKLPADAMYFAKGRAGFEGALCWLDSHLDDALAALPERAFSLFEVTLFCLVEHLTFRQSLPVEPYPSLVRFAKVFGERPSARATTYTFDVPPAAAAVSPPS